MIGRQGAKGWSGVQGEEGQMALFATVLLAIVVTLVGVAANFGVVVAQRRYAQTAADAAALAGAGWLAQTGTYSGCTSTDSAQKCAQTYATLNGFTDGSGGATVNVVRLGPSTTPCASTNQGSNSSAVQVCISRSVSPMLFGFIANTAVTVSAHAVAVAASTTGNECVFCVLAPTGQALQVNGCGGQSVSMAVSGAEIFVNSNSANGISTSGSHCNLTDTNASGPGTPGLITGVGTGGTQSSDCSSGTGISPTPVCGAPTATDPLASFSPSLPTSPISNSCVSSGTISQGVYRCISATGVLNLNPGTYVITSSFSISGPGQVLGTGVTLYFACPSYPNPCSSSWATFSASGGGSNPPTSTLSAPSSGTNKGMLMMFDRADTSASAFTTSGNAHVNLIGTVYAKSATVNIGGNGNSVIQLDSALIVNQLIISGNGTMNDSFDASQNVTFHLPSVSTLGLAV